MDIRKWIGFMDSSKRWDYNWKDVVLSNIAAGAKSDDLGRVYSLSEDFRAIPTFALIPAFGGVAKPQSILPGIPSGFIQQEAAGGGDFEDAARLGLDWDHDLYVFRPIEPRKGTFMWFNTVDNIYDRGPGKGCVISNMATLCDETRRPVARNYTRTVLFAEGGFGGDPVPRSEAVFPERAPDVCVDEYIDDKVHLIYGLANGGQAPIHTDEAWCQQKANQPHIVVQGHATFSYACRIAIDAVIPGEDARMTHIYAQFRNPLFPNTHLRFLGWIVGGTKKMYFKVVNTDDNDKVILNNGIFEWD